MASTSLRNGEETGLTQLDERKQTTTQGMEIATLEQFGNLVERCVITEPSDPGFITTVIDVSKFLAAVSENFSGIKEDELKRYSKMMAKMSSQYKDNPELLKYIADWCESRKKLIKIADSYADELDQNIQAVYLSQLFSLIVEMLSLFYLNVYEELSSSIASYASNISPIFGLIIECTLPLLPNLKYTGAICSLFENVRTEILIRRVWKAMQEDQEKFEPLKRWFEETNQFEDSVKQLFPYKIDKNIIASIEKCLKDQEEEQKIFATAVFFATKKDPNLSKNSNILVRILLFCRSDAAKEWYRRMVTGACPLNLESSILYIRNQLQELEKIDAEPGLVFQIGKFTFSVQSVLPRLLLFGMNGMSVFFCCRKIKSGARHRYSIGLRELVKNTQSFWHTMEEIRIQRSSLTY